MEIWSEEIFRSWTVDIMKRYFKIYSILVKINIARLFAYRANFLNSIVGSLVWSIFNILSITLLTTRTSTVFGWSRYELMLLIGIYNIIFSIFYIFFARNFTELSNTIHFGRLDAILLRPIDSQFAISFWFSSAHQVIRLAIGILFTLYLTGQMHLVLSPFVVLGFFILIFFSIVIMYSIWFIVLTLTLWFSRLSNLVDLMYQINGIVRFPQEMYKSANLIIFYALFPLTFVIVSPAKALLQKILLGEIVWPIICSIALLFISRKFWQFALRSYTSASG